MFDADNPLDPLAERFLEEVRRADGLIISSPGYHGAPSGLVKNALDYIEALRLDEPAYLEGRAVGCIVCAAGWQATTTTLVSLRSIVHALRGWPTPLGVCINSAVDVSPGEPTLFVASVCGQLEIVGQQVVDFARLQRGAVAR
jgi:FMN reductase